MSDGGESDICENAEMSAAILALRTLLQDLLAIDLPTLKECISKFHSAFESSWHALSAWASVLALVLSPILQLLAVIARAVWPHAKGGATALWRYQASLPLSTLLAEAAAVVLVVLALLLRRFIVRRRYLPRAQRRVRLFRGRLNRRYVAFTAAVERNFRLSARAFPHVVYWAAAGSCAWLAPGPAAWLRENFSVTVAAAWPTLYALYLTLLLRSQDQDGSIGGGAGAGADTPRAGGAGVGSGTPGAPASARRRTPAVTGSTRGGSDAGSGGDSAPGAMAATKLAKSPGSALGARTRGGNHFRVMPQDVDRVLMYWVVFTVVRVAGLVPLASTAVDVVGKPFVRSIAFFLVLWMHLPGPGSGVQVVYASLEPLVHKHVRDLRMPKNQDTGVLKNLQNLLVFARVLTKGNAELLADSVADSWMLAPALLCFFTPSFITNYGCVYAGLVVPSFNSIKTLGRGRLDASDSGTGAGCVSDGWAALATSAGSARVRWLTYWVAYGGLWLVSWNLGGLLRILPLATHAQLALLLWLQVPLFRGGGRILDFGERCLERWVNGAAGGASTPPPPRPPESQLQ